MPGVCAVAVDAGQCSQENKSTVRTGAAMTSIAKEIISLASGEARNIEYDFVDQLTGSDVLTGTPTAAEVSRTLLDSGGIPTAVDNGFTLDNVAKNPAFYTMESGERRGQKVKVNQAIVFRVDTDGVALGKYAFKVSCGTDNSSAETLIGYVRVNVVGA